MEYHHWPLAVAIGLIVSGAVRSEEAPPATEAATGGRPAMEVEGRPMDDFHQAALLPSEQNYVAGINRVIADRDGDPVDLDVGERLPGRGRSFFIRAEYRF